MFLEEIKQNVQFHIKISKTKPFSFKTSLLNILFIKKRRI